MHRIIRTVYWLQLDGKHQTKTNTKKRKKKLCGTSFMIHVGRVLRFD